MNCVDFLTNNEFGVYQGGPGAVDAGTQGAKTFLIRWCNLDQGYVGGDVSLVEELWDFVEENRNGIGTAIVYRCSDVSTDEQTDGPEVL